MRARVYNDSVHASLRCRSFTAAYYAFPVVSTRSRTNNKRKLVERSTHFEALGRTAIVTSGQAPLVVAGTRTRINETRIRGNPPPHVREVQRAHRDERKKVMKERGTEQTETIRIVSETIRPQIPRASSVNQAESKRVRRRRYIYAL